MNKAEQRQKNLEAAQRMRKLRNDPAFRQKEVERQKRYDDALRADPERAAKRRAYNRQWMKDKRAKETSK